MTIYDWFYETLEYLFNIILSLASFVLDNKVVFNFVFIPIIATCFIFIIDMFFDIRDLFGNVSKHHDYLPYTKMKLYDKYIKPKTKSQLDMDEVYQRSKEHAEYKHNLKMKELYTYRANENIRHSNKLEEQDNFYKNKEAHDLKIKKMQNALNKHSMPKHSNNKKANLDVEVED